MTNEPDDIAHVRLPLISLVLLVALPAALIPVLQFLSISVAGNGASAAGNAAGSLSLAAQPGSVIAGSIIGPLVAYVIGGRKAMFLAVLSIVIAVVAMLAIASPLTFAWGRTALNLGAGALLVLPILVLGHYGSHRQITSGMPGLILGPFIMVALVGLLTRPGMEDRIAALTDLTGLGAIEPMGWLAIVLTILLVLSLFRAMGRARGGRPNALFSAALRADARAALGFVLTGPQIYALLIAMALTGHAATTYLGDFARKSPLEGFGIGSTIAATLCLGFGGFVIARIFGPRRRQHVLATTIVFLLITTGLMIAADIMFAPTAGSRGIFVWPYTQDQLVLLLLTCAAMAMLGASFAMIWLAIVEIGIGVLATTLLVTVLVARIAAPAAVPLLPIPEMWLASGLIGTALVLVALGTMFGRRARNTAAPARAEPLDDFATSEPAEHEEPEFGAELEFDAKPVRPNEHEEPGFDTKPIDVIAEPVTIRESQETLASTPVTAEAPAEPPAPRETVTPDTPEAPPASARPSGGLPWRRKRTKRAQRDAPAKPSTRKKPTTRTAPPQRKEPRASERPDPPRAAIEDPVAPKPHTRHEAVQDTHIDWAKLGATVVENDLVPQDEPAPADAPEDRSARRTEPENAPSKTDEQEDTARAAEDDVAANPPAAQPKSTEPAQRTARPQPTEPTFTRHDSTIFDFDRLRTNTRGPDRPDDQADKDKE